MKKIILCMLFIITAFGFSDEIKLGSKYNKNSTWNICTTANGVKDCGVLFVGNPVKELKMYEDEAFGMIIIYKGIEVTESGGYAITIEENKSASVPKKTGLSSIDKSLAGIETIVISSETSEIMALTSKSEFKNIKKSKDGIIYYNMFFKGYDAFDGSNIN